MLMAVKILIWHDYNKFTNYKTNLNVVFVACTQETLRAFNLDLQDLYLLFLPYK